MRIRVLSTAVVAAGLMLGLSGCNFITPQATAEQYPADAIVSDGISGTVGEVLEVRNALLISEDGVDANLVANLVNRGDQPANVEIDWEGAPVAQTLVIPAGETVNIGHGADEQTITLTGIDATLGQLYEVFISAEGSTGDEFLVPVLDGGLPEYANLAPAVSAE